jgi:hypothetical protein
MSSEPNFQHSDTRMKLSVCETKTMNSFGDFFQNFKKGRFFKYSNFKNALNGLCNKTKKKNKIPE